MKKAGIAEELLRRSKDEVKKQKQKTMMVVFSAHSSSLTDAWPICTGVFCMCSVQSSPILTAPLFVIAVCCLRVWLQSVF